MTEKEVLAVFEDTDAILKGHFRLTSGRHSGTYMQCAKLFTDTKSSEKLCAALAEKLKGIPADMIVSPAVGGILMGYEVARQMGLPNIFAERENGVMTLRRGFSLPENAKVIVVEDVVTTGGSVKEVAALMTELGAEVTAVASIVDRSGGKADFGTKFVSLISINIESYEEADCPICKEGKLPLVKPGSRIFNK